VEIIININKKHLYLSAILLGIFFTFLISKAVDTSLPWHPITQIVNRNGQPIANSTGDLDMNNVIVENSLISDHAGSVSGSASYLNGLALTDALGNTEIKYARLFWTGSYSGSYPYDPNQNLKLCYYVFNPSLGCSVDTSITCYKKTKQVGYTSEAFGAGKCIDTYCSKVCQSTVVCDGLLNKESSCGSSHNTRINYDSGACTPSTPCYSGSCSCTCTLSQDKPYEIVHQGNTKNCLPFIWHT
jgi:hypothetical protein